MSNSQKDSFFSPTSVFTICLLAAFGLFLWGGQTVRFYVFGVPLGVACFIGLFFIVGDIWDKLCKANGACDCDCDACTYGNCDCQCHYAQRRAEEADASQ
jgi:hypothetical protein